MRGAKQLSWRKPFDDMHGFTTGQFQSEREWPDLYASRVRPLSLSSYVGYVASKLCATPKEPSPNRFRIKLIPSVQFPDNASSPVGCKPTISPLNSFLLAPRQVKLEEHHDATQISKWIFDQEKQQD
jgi:hypothetical protein